MKNAKDHSVTILFFFVCRLLKRMYKNKIVRNEFLFVTCRGKKISALLKVIVHLLDVKEEK